MLAATNPSVSLERRQTFTLEAACARLEIRRQVAAPCARVGRLGLMRGAALATRAARVARIGLAALAGIVTLARASLAIVQTATTTVIGRKVTEEQSPALWRFVRETARRASAVP